MSIQNVCFLWRNKNIMQIPPHIFSYEISTKPTATDKALFSSEKGAFFIRKMLISFLFLDENMLWYSLEVSQRGASNEYPQHMFSLRNRKIIMWIPPLICSYAKSNIQKEVRKHQYF